MSDRYPSEQGLQYLLFVSICLSVLKAYTIWQSLSLPKIYCIYNTQLSILIIGIFQNVPFEFYLPLSDKVFISNPFYELLHYNCHMITLLVETSMKSVLSCLLVLFVSLRAIILLGLVIINV